MRWEAQTLDAPDAQALPGLARLHGLVRSVTTPEFAGITFHEVMAKSALNAVPADSTPAWLNDTPANRTAQIQQRMDELKSLTQGTEQLYQSGNETLLSEYLQRSRTEGEESALRWIGAAMWK